MRGLSDTSPEAERVWIETFRRMSPERKLRLQGSDFRCERMLHAAGYMARVPDANATEIQRDWLRRRLGAGPWLDAREGSLMNVDRDNLDVVREVIQALDALGIVSALGGSWASSYYGESRSTRDADFSVEAFPGKEEQLVGRFGPDYYVSLEAVKQAVKQGRSFNIINTVVGFKVDLFVTSGIGYERELMSRRTAVTEPDSPLSGFVLITAEDTVLRKLEWYRMGGEISERQWLDVQGVLRTQAERLDRGYMEHWADELRVRDLLDRALAEAGL